MLRLIHTATSNKHSAKGGKGGGGVGAILDCVTGRSRRSRCSHVFTQPRGPPATFLCATPFLEMKRSLSWRCFLYISCVCPEITIPNFPGFMSQHTSICAIFCSEILLLVLANLSWRRLPVTHLSEKGLRTTATAAGDEKRRYDSTNTHK